LTLGANEATADGYGTKENSFLRDTRASVEDDSEKAASRKYCEAR
jgi:hypothetical protein